MARANTRTLSRRCPHGTRQQGLCEKPLTHGIYEARRVHEAAAKANVATQMGIQMHATENYRRIVELVQSGAIGSSAQSPCLGIAQVGDCKAKRAATKHKDIVYVANLPTTVDPVPEGLDWDLWLGPAPAPVQQRVLPGPKWYRWWDFGSGTMSDLGSHWNDLPFWALKLGAAEDD